MLIYYHFKKVLVMRVLKETICSFCKSIFCCAECRYKHEIKNHAIVIQKPIKENEKEECGTNKTTECDEIYVFCPICANQPLILSHDLHKEILLHIELFHFPLRCQKCFTTYNKISDLREHLKCLSQSHVSVETNKSCCTEKSSKVNFCKATMPKCIISENSPSNGREINEGDITPISLMNMRWKARSKLHQEEFISDSVSSIKNLSSISNSSNRQSSGTASATKGKVIRCSSTPVQLEMVLSKPKEQTFNATGNHISSIQYNSGCESDTSPAFSQPNSQALEQVNRYLKVGASRPRMTAVTPLRQVMSKSIQKAFAEHGLPSSDARRIAYTLQRKNMFDSNSSPELDDQRSPIYPALDLRLSPAVRRSQKEMAEFASRNNKIESNELPYLKREILLSAQKLTTESIVITHTEQVSSVSTSTSGVSSNFSINSVKPFPKSVNSCYESAVCNSTGNSVFKSCSCVEIITATTEEIHSFDQKNIENPNIPPITPIARVHGSSINKKIIKFDTPKIKISDDAQQPSPSSPNDEFFTPNSTPMTCSNEAESAELKQRKLSVKHNLNSKFSSLKRAPIRECAISRVGNSRNSFDVLQESDNEDDELFLPVIGEKSVQGQNLDKNENLSQKPKGLWSIMTSVMRLPSLKGKTTKETLNHETYSTKSSTSNSIIKRCASIAGSLARSKPLLDENELCSLKRKRTYTIDNQSTLSSLTEQSSIDATSLTSNTNTSSKRFRIQGRRPIDRMRKNS